MVKAIFGKIKIKKEDNFEMPSSPKRRGNKTNDQKRRERKKGIIGSDLFF